MPQQEAARVILDADESGVLVSNLEDGTVDGYESGDLFPSWSLAPVVDADLTAVCQERCPDAAVFPAPRDLDGTLLQTSEVTWVTGGKQSPGPAANDGSTIQVLHAVSSDDYVLARHMPRSELTTIVRVSPGSPSLQTEVPGGIGTYFESPSGDFAVVRTADSKTSDGSVVWVKPEFAGTDQPPLSLSDSGPASICLDDAGDGLLLNDYSTQRIAFPEVVGTEVAETDGGQSQCFLFDGGRSIIGSVYSEGDEGQSTFRDAAPARTTRVFETLGIAFVSTSRDGRMACLSGSQGAQCWTSEGGIVYSNAKSVQVQPVGGGALVALDVDGRLTWWSDE